MGKKLKSISLVLFSICCTVGFSMSVNAETLEIEMTKDMTSSEINTEISNVADLDAIIIDGKDEFTITGGLSFNSGIDVTIKNVTIDGLVGDPESNADGSAYQNILLNLVDAGNVVVDNVDFIHYDGKGLYAEFLTSLTVTNSSFDSLDTVNIGNNDYSDNEDEPLILRSASAIDLNFGNDASDDKKDNYGKVLDVKSIEISGNTFKNVEATTANSTAGAIKIKIKDGSTIPQDSKGIESIVIQNNTFVDNDQDLVIGTDSPEGITDQNGTGNFDILLVNNGAMFIANNSDAEKPTETLEGNYKLNYALDKKYELDENLYYIVNDANIDEFENPDNGIVNDVMADDDIKGLAFNIEGVSFAISKETFNDENLDEALESLSNVNPTTETTVEALKQYQNEGVFFMDIDGLDIFDNGIHYSASLGEELSGNLFVYFFDEENGLQLVSNSSVEDGNINLSFTKNGHYVISEADLLTSLPSDETPSEEVPEVPQTFDSLGIYAGIGIISVVGIASAVIYLKRKNA